MENRAKDFFMHLGAIVALYATVASFLNLLFSTINKAYPVVNNYVYFGGDSPEISFAVATLIIVFPIFIILSWINHRSYEKDPEKRKLGVRKWLTYVTLFIAGVILAGDLVSVLYRFLDGQDLTTAFLLKALSVLLVSGLVFGFYLQDIRNKISKKQEKVWAIVSAVIILIAIVLGFSVIGSPQNQRLARYDEQKVRDLQSIEWEVINSWQISAMIPEQLESVGVDPQDLPYIYRKTGPMTFELCATFNRISEDRTNRYYAEYPTIAGPLTHKNQNWTHPTGNYCFQREIDPLIYPTQVRG